MDVFLHYFNYWAAILIMLIGLYGIIAKSNLIKKVISLGLFQTGILIFYISTGRIDWGTGPVNVADPSSGVLYSNPIPHALMLTAIVVGVATMGVALAIVVNIRDKYGTIDEHDIEAMEHERGS
jgi:multicomponent Na+:H+ antiporter subunit C